MNVIAEEAAEWVLRRMEDQSAECNAELLRWLKLSPSHIDEFLLATATCAALKGSAAGRSLDVDELVRQAQGNVLPFDGPAAQTESSLRQPRRSRAWLAAAAVAALSIGLSVTWYYQTQSNIYTTAVGEQRAIRLPDGSLLNLNTRSRIEVRFSEQARELRLIEGEALFTVAQDTTRPFTVVTDSAKVRAIGTQFNVYSQGERTNVSVVEGRVSVAPTQSTVAQQDVAPVLLNAGEQAEVVAQQPVAKRVVPDVETAVAWQHRRFVFRAAPLAEVAEQFNRYNDYQIRIEDAQVAQKLVWGVFGVDEPQALVKFLAQDPALSLLESKDGLAVRPKPVTRQP